MSGRWASSNRRAELPADWPERRFRVRLRAGGRCEAVDDGVRCPAMGSECDHIVRGNNHALSNLQWLCAGHHGAKTRAEALAALMARPRMRRAVEQHPAL